MRRVQDEGSDVWCEFNGVLQKQKLVCIGPRKRRFTAKRLDTGCQGEGIEVRQAGEKVSQPLAEGLSPLDFE